MGLKGNRTETNEPSTGVERMLKESLDDMSPCPGTVL